MEGVHHVPLRGAMVYTQRNRRRTPACVLVAMLCVATDEWTLCVQGTHRGKETRWWLGCWSVPASVATQRGRKVIPVVHRHERVDFLLSSGRLSHPLNTNVDT